jgi:hypothetical protein
MEKMETHRERKEMTMRGKESIDRERREIKRVRVYETASENRESDRREKEKKEEKDGEERVFVCDYICVCLRVCALVCLCV